MANIEILFMDFSEKPGITYTNFRKIMIPCHSKESWGVVIETISIDEVHCLQDIKEGLYTVPIEYDYVYFSFFETKDGQTTEIKTGRFYPNPILFNNTNAAKNKFGVNWPGISSLMYEAMIFPELDNYQVLKSRSNYIYRLDENDFIIRGGDWNWKLSDE